MSKKKRLVLVAALTALEAGFAAYVCKVVLPRKDFRPVDLITVSFTLLALFKNIQLIAQEVKHHGRN